MISIESNTLIVDDDFTKESLVVNNIFNNLVAIHIYDTKSVTANSIVAKVSRVRVVTIHGDICISTQTLAADVLLDKIISAFKNRAKLMYQTTDPTKEIP